MIPECVARLSSSWKIGINGCSIRHLTLTESPALHTVGRMHELELASHMRAAWFREIRDHTSCVVSDEVRRRVYPPVTPEPAASTAPAGPEGPDAINCRVFGDLEILSAVSLAARQRGMSRAGYCG